MALPEFQRNALAALLGGEGAGIALASIAGPPIALDTLETVAFEAGVVRLRTNLDALVLDTAGESAGLEAASLGEEMSALLAAYYADPTPSNFSALELQILSFRDFTGARAAVLGAEADSLRSEVEDIILVTGAVLLLAVASAGIVVFYISHRIGVSLRQTITSDLREQTELAATSSRLSFRNDQLRALYNVFTEITDTLSLDYVAAATLRESMKLMRADMATLRILRGDELVPVGAMTSAGQEIEGLQPVQLGVGPTGRTAKRGRTMRVDEGGERLMTGQPGGLRPGQSPSEQTNRAPMESGMIVPLVVGARVVGTLACWSRNQEAFNDEDQRILEMMASQVATAIAAAETTETSERRAHQDSLTSLPNRRQLDEDLEHSLAELARQGREAAVAMLDIDNFKLVNDQHGHQVGDVTLQRIATVLRRSIRETDYVYRFGGEEFVIIFTDTTIEEAEGLAERLRAAVSAIEITRPDGDPVAPATVSIGLAQLPQHGTDLQDLIDLADKAMYRAKTDGRDRVAVWSEQAATAEDPEAA